MTIDPLAYARAEMDAAEKAAEKARDFDYARCGSWEARGPYPAADGEADGVSRPRGNLRSEIGRDDIFLEAELPWDLIPHMARHDPAAVLRRIKADRKLIELHAESDFPYNPDDGPGDYSWTARCDGCYEDAPCTTLRLIAEGWGWAEET